MLGFCTLERASLVALNAAMSQPPPLAVFDPSLARAIATAYRKAYLRSHEGRPHGDGLASAIHAFNQRFPYPDKAMASATVRLILSAIEFEHPGWLSNNSPRRAVHTDPDARAEVEDIGRRWL